MKFIAELIAEAEALPPLERARALRALRKAASDLSRAVADAVIRALPGCAVLEPEEAYWTFFALLDATEPSSSAAVAVAEERRAWERAKGRDT